METFQIRKMLSRTYTKKEFVLYAFILKNCAPLFFAQLYDSLSTRIYLSIQRKTPWVRAFNARRRADFCR